MRLIDGRSEDAQAVTHMLELNLVGMDQETVSLRCSAGTRELDMQREVECWVGLGLHCELRDFQTVRH